VNPYSHRTGIIERRSASDSDPFSFRFGYDPGGLRRCERQPRPEPNWGQAL